jgi:hypothetical protein
MPDSTEMTIEPKSLWKICANPQCINATANGEPAKFRVTKSRKHIKYCAQECYAAFKAGKPMSADLKEKIHGKRTLRQIEHVCEVCGKRFVTNRDRSPTCSRECRDKKIASLRLGVPARRKTTREKIAAFGANFG